MQFLFKLLLIATVTLSGVAWAETQSAVEAGSDAVYQDFGGKAGISKVVDDFLVLCQADPRIGKRLAYADMEHLNLMLKEQFAQLTGGPVVYSGLEMKQAHEGMTLRDTDFNALAEDLQAAMDKNGVPNRAQNKLLAKLAPMERQIVTK